MRNSLQKRTWAEVSLDNISHNYRAIRAALPEGCRFLGVVKADAYGHGAVAVARLLEAAQGPVSASALAAKFSVSRQIIVGDVALLRAAAAKAGVSDITQKKDVLRFTLAVFRPEALVQVCGLAKYKFRLTLSAGETPMLTLKLKPGADVLETALELVEDLKLATQALEKA